MAERQKKVMQEKHDRILQDLLKLPGNDHCADCHSKHPRWASYNLGIFLCMRCGGIHRKMGTHISRVKSVSLDSWTPEMIEQMKQGGNIKSNEKFNPHPEKYPLPLAEDDSGMEQYIRKKYERQAFMDKPVEHSIPPRSTSVSPSLGTGSQKSSPIVYRDREGERATLKQLREMGFNDAERNRQILAQTGGDIEAAIEILTRLPGGRKPTSSSSQNMTEEGKLTNLWNMGFQDQQKNRDALRRTGGNLEVAAALLIEEKRKAEQTAASSISQDSVNAVAGENNQQETLRQQTNQERVQHKLGTGQLQQTQTASYTPSVNNPFLMAQPTGAPQQQQQQQFAQSLPDTNPLKSSIMSLFNTPAPATQPLQPQVTGMNFDFLSLSYPNTPSPSSTNPLVHLSSSSAPSLVQSPAAINSGGGLNNSYFNQVQPQQSQLQPQPTGFNSSLGTGMFANGNLSNPLFSHSTPSPSSLSDTFAQLHSAPVHQHSMPLSNGTGSSPFGSIVRTNSFPTLHTMSTMPTTQSSSFNPFGTTSSPAVMPQTTGFTSNYNSSTLLGQPTGILSPTPPSPFGAPVMPQPTGINSSNPWASSAGSSLF